MSTTDVSNSLDRNPELIVASTYRREVFASLERVWENVYDWEHLPWIHSKAFNAIDLVDSGDWGWRARIELAGQAKAEIELIADRSAGRYVARTFAGAGAPTEIWTSLEAVAEDRTAIQVEFCVAPMSEDALRKLGGGFVSLYTLLWDQDEEMMRVRQAALDQGPFAPSDSVESRRIGRFDEIRSKLPMAIEFAGRSFRIIEVAGELVAHSTECPHRLGPLNECEIVDGSLTCPWHGYRFDARTGRSVDGRSLRLPHAPRIVIDSASQEVTLVADDSAAQSPTG